MLLKARPLIAAIDDPWAKRKLKELDNALALCAGLWLDATADRAEAVPGSTVKIDLEVINRSHFPIAWTGHSLLSNDGMGRESGGGTAASDAVSGQHNALPYNAPSHVALTRTVPQNESYSQPYWLRRPHPGDLYEIDQQQLIGRADSAPVLTARPLEVRSLSERADVWCRLRKPKRSRTASLLRTAGREIPSPPGAGPASVPPTCCR